MSTAHRQYSRKFAAILTVLAMVLALFPVAAFAQEQPKFSDIAGLKLAKEIEEAAKAGLIEGYPDGTFKPKQNVTRAEFAKMIVNALEQATGKALPTGEEPFSDVSEDSTLYEYVVKAYNAKLIQGYEDGRFGYSDPIQRQQAAAIIARALGLEETEENFPDVDPKYHRLAGLIGAVAKAGLMQGYDNGNFGPTDNVQRDQAAAIAVRAYNYLLAQKPAALEVAEVRVPNLKQVEIVFNQAVDKASAENVANYRVYAEDDDENLIDEGTAELQSDGKTVLLTLEGEKAFENNSKENKVEVLTGVKSANGQALEKAYSTTVAALDTVTPSAASVTQVGSRWLKVVFNEPVKPVPSKAQVRIDDGSIPVKSVEADYASRSLLVTTFSEIGQGDHTVTVLKEGVVDFAGLDNGVDQQLQFKAAIDETVPTVEVVKATPTQIVLSFSQGVVIPANDNIRFRAVYNDDAYEIKAASDAARIDPQPNADKLVTKVTLSFEGDPLPLGAQKLYIEYVDDNSSSVIKSGFGVKLPEQALDMEVVADTTKPAVAEIKVVDSDTIHVIFNKAVEQASAEDEDNYSLKDANGNVVAVYEAKRVQANVVELTVETLQGGTYVLTVKNVKDTAYPRNIMEEFTGTFEAKDTVNPELRAAEYVDGNTILLTFSEPMATSGAGAVTNPDRYQYTENSKRGSWQTLDRNNDKVTVSSNGRVVTIKLGGAARSWGTNSQIKIGYVTDVAGNQLKDADGKVKFEITRNLTQASVGITDAAFTAVNKLQVTFDRQLDTVVKDDFQLTVDDNSVEISKVDGHTVKDGRSIVTFTLASDVAADATGTLRVVSQPQSRTIEGIKVQASATAPVRDEIAPALVPDANKPVQAVDTDGDGDVDVIRIYFTEPVASFGPTSFKVTGYRVDEARYYMDRTPTDRDESVIELVVTAEQGASKSPTVELVTPVRDKATPANESGKWSKKAEFVGS